MTWTSIFGLVMGAAVVGCSTSSSGSSSSGSSAAQACSDSAHARCTRWQSCSAQWIAELYGTESNCETRVKENCTNALAAPGNANTPSNVEACSMAVPSWACSDILTGSNPPSACAQVMGGGANGSACSAAGQCQSGFCDFSNSACGSCAPAPAENEACTVSRQCGPGLSCSGNMKCVTASADGDGCSNSQPCAPGTMCISGTCKTVDTTVGAGQPCGLIGGQVVDCTSGNCEAAEGGLACVSRAPDGAPCRIPGGPYCESPALCIQGTCQQPACH